MRKQSGNKFILLTLLCVLAILGFASKPPQFALHVFGDIEVVGATISIDGSQVGTMSKFSPEASHFTKWLPVGVYTVEVRKDGYEPFRQTITISSGESEYYIEAKLSRQSK